MTDWQVISVWKAGRPGGGQVNSHAHEFHELVYYVQGSGQTVIGGQTWPFAEGHFALIPPQVEHEERHHTDCRVICLEMAGLSEEGILFWQDTDGAVLRILRELLTEARLQPFGYREMMALKLNELHLHLRRRESGVQQERSFEYIVNYLRENYHEKIRLSDCARQLNLSYDYFQHRFKALTGYSPQQFLVRRRLEVAAALLRTGQDSCTAIAYRCGFSTSAQFSALFRRTYGLSPQQYRRQQRNER